MLRLRARFSLPQSVMPPSPSVAVERPKHTGMDARRALRAVAVAVVAVAVVVIVVVVVTIGEPVAPERQHAAPLVLMRLRAFRHPGVPGVVVVAAVCPSASSSVSDEAADGAGLCARFSDVPAAASSSTKRGAGGASGSAGRRFVLSARIIGFAFVTKMSICSSSGGTISMQRRRYCAHQCTCPAPHQHHVPTTSSSTHRTRGRSTRSARGAS